MNKPDWLNIDTSRSVPPILMLGRIDTSKNPEAQRAKTTESTQQSFKEIVTNFLNLREADEFLPYSDTGIVGEDQTFVGNLDAITRSMPEVEEGMAEDTALLV